jgi:tRNA-splicing ligase RtcB
LVSLQDLVCISDYEWEIPKSYREDMRVPVRIFATRKLLEKVMDDRSLEQAVNSATLPGLVGHMLVMPDMHQGYGFPIGGVAATRYPDGVISPGGIGYDINCGVRLLASQIELAEALPYLEDLATTLNQYCPSGVGQKGDLRMSEADLNQVCLQGARWTLKHGYTEMTETNRRGEADRGRPPKVSKRAKERGRPQLGTLVAGNHFIEVDVVDQVFDSESARVMGLAEGRLVLQIHCGSRGFGHQICSDYVDEFQAVKNTISSCRIAGCLRRPGPEGQITWQRCCAANLCIWSAGCFHARRAFEDVLAGKTRSWQLH